MIINTEDIADGESIEINFLKNIIIPKSYCNNNSLDVNVKGTILNNNNKYIFNANISTVLKLCCDLCLNEFCYELNFDISEIYSRTENSEDDYLLFSGNMIDLEPAVLNGILLNIPMKAICSDDCKGLCSICGHNLNYGECGCNRAYINPKFEKLKTLFKDSKEV